MSPIRIHGHRGCGGPFPQNTLPAFLHAQQLGCHGLEMDVVITGDGHVLVSHEPWMDPDTCLDPNGAPLPDAVGKAFNLYEQPLAEIQRYRVRAAEGGRTAPKPTLAEVVVAVDAAASGNGPPSPLFNIEVKSDPAWYGMFQPAPAALAHRIAEEIEQLALAGRCLVQCFDPALLNLLHGLLPQLPLALLVENADGVQADLARLSFIPAYYSAAHPLVDRALVSALHAQGIRVLAWTVNDATVMRHMMDLGVYGLITDDPEQGLRERAAWLPSSTQ